LNWDPIVIAMIVGGVLGVVYVLVNLQRGIDGQVDFPMPSVGKIVLYGFLGLLMTGLLLMARR
jgi:hypothetical protein